jgi:hypothetical protein
MKIAKQTEHRWLKLEGARSCFTNLTRSESLYMRLNRLQTRTYSCCFMLTSSRRIMFFSAALKV